MASLSCASRSGRAQRAEKSPPAGCAGPGQVQHHEHRRLQCGGQRGQQFHQGVDTARRAAHHDGGVAPEGGTGLGAGVGLLTALPFCGRCGPAARSRRTHRCAPKTAATPWSPGPETPVAQRLAEQPQGAVLQVALEVDEHIAARHQMDFGEHAVGGQAVVGEHHVFAQPLVEHHAAIGQPRSSPTTSCGRQNAHGSR